MKSLTTLSLLLVVQAAHAFYEPSLGRWINRDPIGELGGLNLYVYVNNSPISLIDPLGLFQDVDGSGRNPSGPTFTAWQAQEQFKINVASTAPSDPIKGAFLFAGLTYKGGEVLVTANFDHEPGYSSSAIAIAPVIPHLAGAGAEWTLKDGSYVPGSGSYVVFGGADPFGYWQAKDGSGLYFGGKSGILTGGIGLDIDWDLLLFLLTWDGQGTYDHAYAEWRRRRSGPCK